MKPLREELDLTDPNLIAGAALLSRVTPLDDSTGRKRRVRVALQTTPPKRGWRVFSPLLVAAVLLVAATGTSATGVRLWKRSQFWTTPEPAARTVLESVPRGPVSPALPASPVVPVAPEAAVGSTLAVPALDPASGRTLIPVAPRLRGSMVPMVPRAAPSQRATAPGSAVDPASRPGASLMVEAMQARKAGDATRSAALLSEYQRKYPQGAFQEEALALSIESAAARGSESAPRLATEYLRRFPTGRFRDAAQRALKSSTR